MDRNDRLDDWARGVNLFSPSFRYPSFDATSPNTRGDRGRRSWHLTVVADSGHAYAVWTDSRNATSCAAVDAFRAGTGPEPDVITQCPNTFGNTDIVLGTVSY